MRAEDFRRVRQVHELGKRGPHLRRRPLEQPAAAHGEQGVAAEKRVRAGEPIGAVAAGVAIASAKGTSDNKNQANNTVISNPTQDTVNYLTADEAYNLVSNDINVRDEIAAGIYYKDIGSRKGLTVAESDVEYTGSSTNVKNVYSNKVITDIRKLVTEGYIKIERQSQDVEIATERATV